MAKKYLDNNGVLYLWQKLKNYFVAKETGKGLSSNDFTNALATKLDGIATGAEVNVQADWNETNSLSDAYIANKPTIPTTASDVSAIPTTDKGAANGVCPLNSSSKIDSAYLPSYVDDMIEAYAVSGATELSSTWLAEGSTSGTVITPETGKLYVLMNDTTNYAVDDQFRWTGSAYHKMNDGGVSAITNGEIDTILAN